MNVLKNPFIPLLILLTFITGYVYLPLSQNAILAGMLVVFSFLSFIYPQAGINILMTIFPFCLGNSKRGNFIYIEIIILAVILSSLLHFALKKDKKINIPFALVAFVFVLSVLLSLPLDFKETYYFLRGTEFSRILKSFLGSNENSPMYFFRTFYNVASGFFVFLSVSIFFKNKKNVFDSFKVLMAVYVISLVFSLLIYFDVVSVSISNYRFLTVFLRGTYPIGPGKIALTAFAFNPGYWGQFLILVLPFSFYFAFINKVQKFKVFSLLILSFLGILILPFTYQRGPVIGVLGQSLFFIILMAAASKNPKRVFLMFSSILLLGILSFIMADLLFTKGNVIKRFIGVFNQMSLRDKVWKVSFTMFKDQPLLGVGSGKFHYFFKKYCKLACIPWEGHIKYIRTTAHNLYLHILAEQGVIGLVAFLALVFSVFKKSIFSFFKIEGDEKYLIFAILTSLAGFLSFGIGQHMFYLRMVQIYFWMVLGFLSCLVRPYSDKTNISLKPWFRTTAVFFIIFIYRFFVVNNYKV